MNEELLPAPDHVQPIIEELIESKFLSEAPMLSEHQWKSIESYVEPFAYGGPNRNARHIRRRNAYFLIISDALSSK